MEARKKQQNTKAHEAAEAVDQQDLKRRGSFSGPRLIATFRRRGSSSSSSRASPARSRSTPGSRRSLHDAGSGNPHLPPPPPSTSTSPRRLVSKSPSSRRRPSPIIHVPKKSKSAIRSKPLASARRREPSVSTDSVMRSGRGTRRIARSSLPVDPATTSTSPMAQDQIAKIIRGISLDSQVLPNVPPAVATSLTSPSADLISEGAVSEAAVERVLSRAGSREQFELGGVEDEERRRSSSFLQRYSESSELRNVSPIKVGSRLLEAVAAGEENSDAEATATRTSTPDLVPEQRPSEGMRRHQTAVPQHPTPSPMGSPGGSAIRSPNAPAIPRKSSIRKINSAEKRSSSVCFSQVLLKEFPRMVLEDEDGDVELTIDWASEENPSSPDDRRLTICRISSYEEKREQEGRKIAKEFKSQGQEDIKRLAEEGKALLFQFQYGEEDDSDEEEDSENDEVDYEHDPEYEHLREFLQDINPALLECVPCGVPRSRDTSFMSTCPALLLLSIWM